MLIKIVELPIYACESKNCGFVNLLQFLLSIVIKHFFCRELSQVYTYTTLNKRSISSAFLNSCYFLTVTNTTWGCQTAGKNVNKGSQY